MAGNLAFDGSGFTVSRIVVGQLDNNAYLIQDSTTGNTLLVDAPDDAPSLIDFVGKTRLLGVFTTHGHWDHHQAIPELTHALGVPFMLHPLDRDIAEKVIDVDIVPGTLTIGNTVATVLHTPGHTPGSVCLSLDGVVLTGDTLFPGGPGATRFDHSSFTTIIESIENQLFVLPDDTMVLPGHGDPTTMGTERPRLASWIDRGW